MNSKKQKKASPSPFIDRCSFTNKTKFKSLWQVVVVSVVHGLTVVCVTHQDKNIPQKFSSVYLMYPGRRAE